MDFHEGLDSALTFLALKNVKVVKNYGTLPMVWCKAGEVNQVFMTVLRMAAESIEGSGEVRIATEADDSNLTVRITDTGNGMTAEEIAQLFDVNFTKREGRIGMSMGLVGARQTLEKHQGGLEIESSVGGGTTYLMRIGRPRAS